MTEDNPLFEHRDGSSEPVGEQDEHPEMHAEAESAKLAADVKPDLEAQLNRGSNWFFWIAGLSLINSITFLMGSEGAFVIGLGITQIIDGIVMEFWEDAGFVPRIIAFGLDVIAASFVVMFGILGRKRLRWALIVGMSLYAVDGLLFLLAMDVLSIGFHIFALFGIYGGIKACGQLNEQERKSPEPGVMLKPQKVGLAEGINERQVPKAAVWPVVIAIISFVYVVFYAILTVRNLSQYWRISGCVFLLGGVAGIALKRKIGAKLIWIGSGVIVVHTIYRFVSALPSISSDMPAVVFVIMWIFMLFVLFWPLFLIVWFLRRSVREYVERQWN